MSSPQLIGLSGYARAGKDTVASFLCTEAGYRRVGFADALREVALDLDPTIYAPSAGHPITLRHLIDVYGWEHAKDEWPDVRRLLQRLGTEVGRKHFGEDIWVALAMRKVDGPTVFTDCRFPNEAHAIKRRGGEVWRIERPGFGPINGHPSEYALDDFPFDRVITNDSTPDALRRAVLGG